MNRLLEWAKKNKVSVILLIALLFVLAGNGVGTLSPGSRSRSTSSYDMNVASDSFGMASAPMAELSYENRIGMPFSEPAPTKGADRTVVSNSHLSLLVNDVQQTVSDLRQFAASLGGYMVDSSVSRPEEGGSGSITLRLPSDKLEEALANIKSRAVKVVSENLTGTDVTDTLVDNAARLAILERNKLRFEQIMSDATDIDDILQVQSQIFSLQEQIDRINGQQNFLKQTAALAKVTIYLSTDELALPYAPANTWRPEVVFKQAIRSLRGTLQDLGTNLIWLGVYAVIWLPLALLALLVYLRNRSKSREAMMPKQQLPRQS